jgi:hypothetical protein
MSELSYEQVDAEEIIKRLDQLIIYFKKRSKKENDEKERQILH